MKSSGDSVLLQAFMRLVFGAFHLFCLCSNNCVAVHPVLLPASLEEIIGIPEHHYLSTESEDLKRHLNINMPRRYAKRKIQTFATRVAWYMCVSVCLLVTTMICAKTSEPIEMLFGVWTRGGPRNHILLDGGCTLAAADEYDSRILAQLRCCLMSD